jgi:flagella synthesis protein FlgN
MQAWVESEAGKSAADAWQQLLKLTREAKELNRVNGMLINKQMAHNQGLINAMRQPANGAEATVYGPGGLTTQGGPSRRFVVG